MKKWLPHHSLRQPEGSAFNSSDSWYSLKNRFAAKRLLRYNYYSLVTGDHSLIKNTNNRKFADLLIDYSIKEKDINLLPALRSIASDSSAGESTQQRASEAVEILEEYKPLTLTSTSEEKYESEEIRKTWARDLLAGTRSPHTTEILRLLRDKSPVQKRYALFIIGKFELAEMLPEVCEALSDPRLAPDACSVLKSFGTRATELLHRQYLSTSGNPVTGRYILKLLGQNCIEDNRAFLITLLGSSLRHIRETILWFLTECEFKAREEEKPHLYHLISDTGRIISWIVALRSGLGKTDTESLLATEMENEFLRWRDYLGKLVYLTFDKDELNPKNDMDHEIQIREWSGLLFPDPPSPGQREKYYRSLYRKLCRYFPFKTPAYQKIHEDIINCDYNHLTVFTKTCALRNLVEIDDPELTDSVIALLFSPEDILREEAARLLARTNTKLSDKVSGRIDKNKVENIGKIMSGEVNQNDFIFEKILFLASFLKGLASDELIMLAGRMIYAFNNLSKIVLPPEGSVIWYSPEREGRFELVIIPGNSGIKPKKPGGDKNAISCFMLPLSAIEEFDYNFPDRSLAIYKLIDDNEV